MRVTLRQLAVFEAVARAGSIVRAVDEIGLSQSAASMSIKELENHLGIELFVRSGRRLYLSERGRSVLELARGILVQVTDLEALTTPEELRGRLRIGASAPVGSYALPGLCADFMRMHPGVRIELRIMPSHEVMDGLRKLALDIGFVGSPVNSSYLDADPWLRDPLVICCAPGNPLATAGPVPLASLSSERWVLEKTLSSERISFTVEALKHFSSVDVVLETDSIEAIKRAVARGAGLACLSRLTVEEEIARGDLAVIEVPELAFTRIFSMVRRRDSQQTTAFHAFRTFALGVNALS